MPGVPMLTVTHGRRATRRISWIYTAAAGALALGTGFTSIGGPVYLAVAVVLNALFLKGAWAIWRRDEADGRGRQLRRRKAVFRSRSSYLFPISARCWSMPLRPTGSGEAGNHGDPTQTRPSQTPLRRNLGWA
jgi:heme O synthase-like polyprenyltransferase